MDWFRSWHGAPTDIKWMLIARKAKVLPGIVSAIGWAIFDHASQSFDRGDVSDFNFEAYSVFSGFDEKDIIAVIEAMVATGLINNGRLTAWDRRQPAKEDPTRNERQARFRSRRKGETQVTAAEVTPQKRYGALRNAARRQNRTEQNRSDSPGQAERNPESESRIPPPPHTDANLEPDGSWEDYERLEAAE